MEQQDTSFIERGLGVGGLVPTSYTNYDQTQGVDFAYVAPRNRESFSYNLRNQLSNNSGVQQDFYIPKIYGNFAKQDISPYYEYGKYDINDRYTRLNDGSFVKKYDVYQQGANNEELNAQLQDQGASSVWGRGIKRFVNQVGTSLAGGVMSLPVGVVSAVNQGSLTALYDNDFTKWLDDLDAKSRANNGIYYSQAEKDLNLFEQLGTKRMWADTVLGGAAFTVGTLGSEALWAVATGGSANVAKWGAKGFQMSLRGAKAGAELIEQGGIVGGVMNKVNSALSKGMKFANDALFSASQVDNAVGVANQASRTAKMLNTGRFMLTSSGYEAGFEARQMKNEALASFEDYYKSLGREATIEERNAFNELSDEQSKNVAIANMAILSVSNMAMLGSIFNIPNPLKTLGFRQQSTAGNYLTKKLFGYGSKMVDGVETAVNRNIFQKTLNGVYKVGKATATEGIWEEGGQGVASKWMQNYVEASYNPTKTQKSISDVDSIWSPYLKEAFAEQYGTKEGLKEVLVGGIIGSLFGIRSIAKASEYKDLDTRVAFNNSGREFSSEYAKNAVATKLGALNRNLSASDEVEVAIENQKPTEATLKAKEQFISNLDKAFTLGRDDSFVGTMVADIENMDSKEIMDTYGVSQEEVDSFKQNTIAEINETSKIYSANREFAENLAYSGKVPGLLEEGDPSKFVQAMSYTMTMGMSARKMAKESRDVLQQLFAESGDRKLSKETDVLTLLSSITKDTQKDISDIVEKTNQNKQRVEQLTNKLRQLDNSRAQNTNYITERNQIADELNEATLEEASLRAKAEAMISLNSKNIFNDEFTITFNDILEGVNFDEYKNAINQYKTNSPQLYNSLSEALYTLEESTNIYKEFDSLMKEFADENVNIKVFRGGMFSSASDDDINKQTYDLLQKLSDKDILQRRGIEEVIDDEPYVTSKEYAEFLNSESQETLPKNILDKLSKKITEGRPLTSLEKEILNERQNEVDEYTNVQKVDEVISKVENNEPLTREEQNVYDQNEQIIEDVLEDPLQYSDGESLEQQEEEGNRELISENRGVAITSKALTRIFKRPYSFFSSATTVFRRVDNGEVTTLQEGDYLVTSINRGDNEYLVIFSEKGGVSLMMNISSIKEASEKDFKANLKSNYPNISDKDLVAIMSRVSSILNSERKTTKLIGASYIVGNEGSKEVEIESPLLTQNGEEESKSKKGMKIPKEFENVLGVEGETISSEEVDELRVLKEKPNKTDEDLNRIKELEEKMYNYNVADGSEFDGWNALDYINYMNSEESKQEAQEDIKNGFTDDEVIRDSASSEVEEQRAFEESEEANKFPAISQVTPNVLVSFKSGFANIHHITLEDLSNLIKSKNPNVEIVDEEGVEITDFSSLEGIAGSTFTARMFDEGGSFEDVVFRIPTYINGKNKGQITGVPIAMESTTPYETLSDLTGIKIRNVGSLKTNFYPAYLEDENGVEEIMQSSEAFNINTTNGYSFDAESASRLKEGDEVEFVITDSDFNTRIGGKTVDDDKDAENVRHQETLVEYGKELLEARGADNVANVKEVLKSLYEKGKVKFSKLYEGLGRLGLMVEEYQNYVNQVNSLESLKGKKTITTAERQMFMPSNFSKRFAIVKENGKSPKTNKKTTASKAKIGNFVNLETGKFFTIQEVDSILINEAVRAIPKVEKPSAKQMELVARDMFVNNEVDIPKERLVEYLPSTTMSKMIEDKIESEKRRHEVAMQSLQERKEKGSASRMFNAMAEIFVVITGTKKVVGRLKASYNLSDKLADLREHLTREFVNSGEEVRVKSEVVKTFLGHPITKMENGVVKRYDATNSYEIRGVINNGEISATDDMDGVITTFIDNVSNGYGDVDIPFIVFTDKISGKRIAYPATIENESVEGAIDEVMDIVDKNLPPLQTAVRINEILFNWGVDDVRLTKENILTEGIIETIVERLKNGQETFKVDKFLSEKPSKVFTTVDVNGQAFLTPKSVISLDVDFEAPNVKVEKVQSEMNKEVVKESTEEVNRQCGTQLSLF